MLFANWANEVNVMDHFLLFIKDEEDEGEDQQENGEVCCVSFCGFSLRRSETHFVVVL